MVNGGISTANWLCRYLLKTMECIALAHLGTPLGEHCPATQAHANCIPRTPYGVTVLQPCEWIMVNKAAAPGVDLRNRSIHWHCNATTGAWEGNPNANECFPGVEKREGAKAEEIDLRNYTIITRHDRYELNTDNDDNFVLYDILMQIGTLGHGTSLVALTVAIGLFLFMRRVMCMRVVIHINLMTSFFLRGLLWILNRPVQTNYLKKTPAELEAQKNLSKYLSSILQEDDIDLVAGSTTSQCLESPTLISSTGEEVMGNTTDGLTGAELLCNIHTSLLNYFSIANYYWLLIEGIYLLLLLKSFSYNKKRCMGLFYALGWVFPALLTMGYLLVQMKHNLLSKCWEEESAVQHQLWWMVKGPILLSLMVNFVIYIMVLRIVASKLNFRHDTARTNANQAKRRLAKSTLSLIPLLGIQYLITGFVDYSNENTSLVKMVKYFEIISTSLQGLLVAVIYCFCSGEIQEEVRKAVRSYKLKRQIRRDSDARRSTSGPAGGNGGVGGGFRSGGSALMVMTATTGATVGAGGRDPPSMTTVVSSIRDRSVGCCDDMAVVIAVDPSLDRRQQQQKCQQRLQSNGSDGMEEEMNCNGNNNTKIYDRLLPPPSVTDVYGGGRKKYESMSSGYAEGDVDDDDVDDDDDDVGSSASMMMM